MRNLTREQYRNIEHRFNEYMELYGSLYSERTRKYIMENFFEQDLDWVSVDILNQVNEATGVFDTVDNIYDQNIREIMKVYDINQDILEVGCGYYPGFASRLSKLQTNGKITVMDPVVIPTSLGNINIAKETFTKETDVSKYKLMIGIMTCEATTDMIEVANQNNLDLYMMLCGCIHKEYAYYSFSYYHNLRQWYNEIEDLLSSTMSPERTYSIDQPEWSRYPIIKTYQNF